MAVITDTEIIQTLKSKAAFYSKLAKELEAHSSKPVPEVTLEAIKEYLGARGARPSELARYFGVLEESIIELINQPDSGIVAVDRGWLKLKA